MCPLPTLIPVESKFGSVRQDRSAMMWCEAAQSNVHTSSVVLYAALGGVEVAIEAEEAACEDVGGGEVMWDDMSAYPVEMSVVAAASLVEPEEEDEDFFSS